MHAVSCAGSYQFKLVLKYKCFIVVLGNWDKWFQVSTHTQEILTPNY